MIGNEGTGLSRAQMELCDRFIYIPQYVISKDRSNTFNGNDKSSSGNDVEGSSGTGEGNGTASLNVATATAIVLHHFAVWAQFEEAKRSTEHDAKFEVNTRSVRTQKRGVALSLNRGCEANETKLDLDNDPLQQQRSCEEDQIECLPFDLFE